MEAIYLKLLHNFALVIFLGNIITELLWMRNAIKTKDVSIVSFAVGSIIKGDKYFTIPGVIAITVSGALSSTVSNIPTLSTGWLLWSIILFVISGLAFTIKVAPLQKKMSSFTLNKNVITEPEWHHLKTIYNKWNFWGLIALITPIIAFALSTIKIPQ